MRSYRINCESVWPITCWLAHQLAKYPLALSQLATLILPEAITDLTLCLSAASFLQFFSMLKTYQFKITVRATFVALNLQISFCQDSWQNIGDRPYLYKIIFKFKCMIHGCWLKQLVSPSLNTTSFVHVRVVTYILSESRQNDICSFRAMNVTLTLSFKV